MIVLTLTMIGGVITVVGLLVTRLPQALSAAPQLPATIRLPEGFEARAVTFGSGWVAVVASDGTTERILVFAPDGRLRQEMAIGP